MGLATDTRLTTLEQLVDRTLGGLGYELADINLSNHGRMLRVFIDKPLKKSGKEPEPITVSDCETATRQLQRVFEVEGVEYDRLEVSSPGMDRRLRKPADFVRFSGCEAEVRLREPMNGRRRYVGVVRQVIGDQVEIEVNGAQVLVPLENLDKARLVPKYEIGQGRR